MTKRTKSQPQVQSFASPPWQTTRRRRGHSWRRRLLHLHHQSFRTAWNAGCQCHKTFYSFYVRKLRVFLISLELTLEWSIWKVLHSDKVRPYSQTLGQSLKAWQVPTLYLVIRVCQGFITFGPVVNVVKFSSSSLKLQQTPECCPCPSFLGYLIFASKPLIDWSMSRPTLKVDSWHNPELLD